MRAEEAVAAVAAVRRGPSLAANPALDSKPETPVARADAPAVAPAASDLTAATEPAPARVSPAAVRQDIPASASFRLPVDSAVIDSLRVSPAQSQPTSVLAEAATGIATLAEGGAALRETVVPPRLREDLRGSRLDTSSDRRFAQLLGETRGAVRVSVAQGESMPVMDAGKGEGAELLFREPGAQAEPGIFRVAADNGSNPTVFSAVGQGGATPQAASAGTGTPGAATPFALPVPEEQVYQQVASRLTLVDGERHSRMTMRLYPEELGQVKLELTVEGDRVRVQMHAQNQQVQEVLEKYLPRLRESFEQQGLKLEEAQVTYDSPGQGGRGSFQESRQSFFTARSAGRSAGRAAGEEEPVVAPPPSSANPRPGGISVRV
ncbi:flagellar hook-length control protein FliK [Trichloromonas acetexigens]|nr:flagellar hook-length control protein FliK [Desulfuromonas acetexigens]